MAAWPAKINDVDYSIDWDSLRMGGDDQAGDTVSLTFMVDYPRLFDFLNGIKGIAGGGYTGRLAFPDSPNLVYRSWESERFMGFGPLQTDSKISHYKKAAIRVTFGPPRYDDQQLLDPANPETAYEIQFDGNAQILRLDNTMIEYEDGSSFDGEMGKVEITGTLNLTFPRLSTIDPQTVFPKLGRINSTMIFGFQPGTVMFAGVGSQQSADDQGNRTKQLQLSFLVQYCDWNAFVKDDGFPMLVRYKTVPTYPPTPPPWWPINEDWPPPPGVRRPFQYSEHREIFLPAPE